MADDGTGRYYVAGNVMEGDEAVTGNNRLGVSDRPGRRYVPSRKNLAKTRGISPAAVPTPGEERISCLVDIPFPFEPIDEDSLAQAYRRVLTSVGCSMSRDTYDTEVLRQVEEGLGTFGNNGIINTPSDVGGWPVLKEGTLLPDRDNDGMPDVWETAHGLNPDDAADASAYGIDKSFTNIEMYLNGLVAGK